MESQDHGPAPTIAAIILAAGEGRRMGGPNKLLAEIGGTNLVRRAAEAALASPARPVVVVTGHRRSEIEQVLAGLPVELVHNPDHADGLSTSLRAGVAEIAEKADGVIVMLADMPFVTAATLDRLIAAFDPANGRSIVVPTHEGRRGNPVLWSRVFFDALQQMEGDMGARRLIGVHADRIIEVEVGMEAAIDVDTPDAASAFGVRIVR